MKRQLLMALLCLTMLSPATGWAQTTYINNGTGYSDTANWTSDTTPSYIRSNARYSQTSTDTATWSLTSTPGSYAVQVYWLAYDGDGLAPSTTNGQYALTHAGGTNNFNFNMLQLARQDSTYAKSGAGTGTFNGSGWRTLGTYNLDGSSSVTLSNLAGSGTLFADAVRISNESVLVDPLSAAGSFNASWFSGTNGVAPNFNSASHDTAGSFAFSNNAAAELTVTPGLAGLRDIKVSWSADSQDNRTTMAQYLVDLDGILATMGDQTTTILDFNLLADQSTEPGSPDFWSGFYDLGQFNLTANSIIVLSNDAGSGFLTPGVLEISNAEVVVPEPSSGIMACICALACLLYRRLMKTG